jgi:hypothetical protein
MSPCSQIELRACRVSRGVHLHPACLPIGDQARALQAAVPPAVEGGRAQRLESVLAHYGDLRGVLTSYLPLLPTGRLDLGVQQVFHRVPAEDEQLDLLPELLGRQG